jgi:hypothetical protein
MVLIISIFNLQNFKFSFNFDSLQTIIKIVQIEKYSAIEVIHFIVFKSTQ